MAKAQDAKARRRHLLARQTVIYGLLIAALVVVGVAAAGMFTGRLDPVLSTPFHSPAPPSIEAVPTPCPSADGAKYPAPGSITIKVLNGSGERGEAQAAADTLAQSGFKTSAGNAKTYRGVVKIVSGIAGIDNAYTVFLFAPKGSVLTMDSREDATVDVLLGEQYERLPPTEDVSYEDGLVIERLPKCQPAADIAATLPPVSPPPSEKPAALGPARIGG
jgi:hypothetical protein